MSRGNQAFTERSKTAEPEQIIAFVCNWRVAVLTDCPDEIIRTEFDPEAFLSGVKKIVAKIPPRINANGAFQVQR